MLTHKIGVPDLLPLNMNREPRGSVHLFVWFPLGLLWVAGAALGLAQGTYGCVPVDLLVAREASLWGGEMGGGVGWGMAVNKWMV